MSQRSPAYQTPGSGAAPSWCLGCPAALTRAGASQEKSPVYPVHHTTAPTPAVLNAEDQRGLTPLFWTHVLPYGEVRLDMTAWLTLGAGGTPPAG